MFCGKKKAGKKINEIINIPLKKNTENIVLNGTLLGMLREEVNDKLEKIIEFSELEEFIDQPIRTYSSGMLARLGFSVAVNCNPDILLVDEVLAVGDDSFQKKCIKSTNYQAFCVFKNWFYCFK